MIKIYKIGFWVLLIVAVTLFNFFTITKNSYKKDISKCKEINEKRVSSLVSSNLRDKRNIKSMNGYNIITKEKRNHLFENETIAILLSDFICNKCQEKELIRLSSLYSKSNANKINIIGLTTKSKINQVIAHRKITGIEFPIYWISKEDFGEISFNNVYPQIIYVKENIIQSGFIPVPMDDRFSEMFYREFLKVIEEPS
jgi:hypothetical protein